MTMDLAIALGREFEAGTVPPKERSVVQSLIGAFSASDNGWTDRQTRMAAALLSNARQAHGHMETLPPVPFTRGGPWWKDTTPHRQALRGIKSGNNRRYRTRDRDIAIERHYRTRKHTQKQLARHHGLSERQIRRIITRIATNTIDISRRTIASTTELLVKNVRDFLSKGGADTNHSEDACFSIPHAKRSDIHGRKPRMLKALACWLRLECNQNATETDVIQEAHYLNTLESEPLTLKELKRQAAAAFKFACEHFRRD